MITVTSGKIGEPVKVSTAKVSENNDTVSVSLDVIKSQAKGRESGYLERLISSGKIDGSFLILTKSDYDAMLADYAKHIGGLQSARCPSCGG